ncbi:MAG TPA: hypothetical protein VEW66_03755, partial [Thermomicrobiales bacterium]|nr:hypothetical protein [Thermomicrobiales bacterium]
MPGPNPEHQPDTNRSRVARVGERPVVKPTQRTRSQPVQPPQTLPSTNVVPKLEDLLPQQMLSVEFQPIGGIFGTITPVAEDDRRRWLRPGRKRQDQKLSQAEASLFTNRDFKALWFSRLFAQSAQGALLYALLILVVDLSDRSVYSSLFVICSIVPSIVFGLPA